MYHQITSGSSAGRLNLVFFTSDGTSISTINGSTFTNVINTWNRAHVGGTSPSTAAYCTLQVQKISGNTEPFISNAQFEEGVTTPSTYVDGDSTGYVWAGIKTGTVTLLASETMNIANGGGGGSGILQNMNADIPGFSGGCSGGGATRSATGSNRLVGGNGGGLGGHAEKYFVTPSAGGTATDVGPEENFYNVYADFGLGSNAVRFSNTAKNNYIGSRGIANSDGYGAGGEGHRGTIGGIDVFSQLIFQDSTSNDAFIARAKTITNGRNNFGEGGSAIGICNLSFGTATAIAGDGGSGLVIIKYWS
jgi:hypothetical protein